MNRRLAWMLVIVWAGVAQAGVGDSIGRCWAKTKAAVAGWKEDHFDKPLAAQRASYGIKLPEKFDAGKPLVLLVHGLDTDNGIWWWIAGKLKESGMQVGYFAYPDDQAIGKSAEMFGQQFDELRGKYPKLRVHLVTHSMGGLVCRVYVEGGRYKGGVEKFVMIAPPNHGSDWACMRFVLELREMYKQAKYQPNWSWVWAVADGDGAAGTDLKPGSAFLLSLNDLHRREGVSYTIIAGNQNILARWAGDCVETLKAPRAVAGAWGVRHYEQKMTSLLDRLRKQEGEGDGAVTVASTKLDGVKDHTVLGGDHNSLFMPSGDKEPLAWPIIKDRLK